MVEISPDVAEAITASAPVKPKKKAAFWTKVFAVVIIITMTGWVFAAYLEGDSNNTDNTNKDVNLFEISGYSFYALQDDTFGTVIKGNGANIPIVFRLDPRNASTISIDNSSATQILTSKKVYVVVNPNQTDLAKIAVAAAEISRIPPLYNISVVGAYTQDSNPSNPDVPIRSCADVSATTSVIYLSMGNETKIENIKGCVYVIGKNADELILAADKLGMNLVGIKL